jgi:hypothetical protein
LEGTDEIDAPPPFWPIGLPKLAALLLATFGLYQLPWQFIHWVHLRDARGWRISPALRGVFFPGLYVFPLAYHFGRASGLPVAGVLLGLVFATGWLTLALACWVGRAPFPLILLPALPVFALQALANRANRLAAPGHDRNARLSGWNIVVIVLGGMLLGLVTLVWLLIEATRIR